MANKIQLRRDIETAWTTVNPVLSQGEVGIDLTNKKIKIGDGITPWVDLEYWNDSNIPETFDGSYASLLGKPTLFSGSYNDLTDTPTLFSGSYNDLTDKPTIPADISALTDTNNLLTAYTPSNLADWGMPAPTTIGQALDRIVAAIKAVNGGLAI